MKSGLEETQELKFSANNILQSCAKVIQTKDAALLSLSVDLNNENMVHGFQFWLDFFYLSPYLITFFFLRSVDQNFS